MAGRKIILPNTAAKAIDALHEGDGATARKITKYLQNTLKNGASITEKDVALALRKAVDKGVVKAEGGKYQTVRVGASELDGRRSRRRSRSRGRRRRSRSKRGRSRRRGRGRRSRSRRRRRSSRRR